MWKKLPSRTAPRHPPAVRGYFDGVIGRRAIGWLSDSTPPFEVPIVEILVDDKLVAEGRANLFRQDLFDAGIGVGNHGFEIVLPEALFDGTLRRVTARSRRHGQFLLGSPKAVNTPLVSPKDALNLADSSALEAVEARLSRLEAAIQEQGALLRSIYQAISNTTAPEEQRQVADRGRFFEPCRDVARPRGDVVLFSIIDWNFRIQRPQHLCAGLAKLGYRVIYVSVQIESLQQPWESRFEVTENPAPGVFEVRLKVSGDRPSVYSGFTDPKQLKDAILAADEMVTALNIRRPHAIVQFPSWFPIAQSLPGAVLVYDCLDHMAGFSNVSNEVAALEKELIARADSVVTSSAYLEEMVSKVRPTTLIRNGCEFEYFSKPPEQLALQDVRPVVGYYGAIAEWFDANLVARLARKHPEWDFALIGSTAGCDTTELGSLPNVTLHGEKPYSELTQYLHAFSACIIPFKSVELIKATNPVKLYEYLSSGKPVVCTDMAEAHTVPPGLVRIAVDFEAFDSALIAAIGEQAEVTVRRRKHWAAENSWDSRVSQYDEILKHAPRVSVVVLTYNGLPFTQACLHSLELLSDYPNLEIVCVDNLSVDGTREYLQSWGAERPQHKVILNDHNLGFAGGNNVGIAAATGDVVILLNNDTYVTNGWIQDLIRPLLQDNTIALAGPVTNMIGGIQKLAIHYRDMNEMAERARAFTRLRKAELYPAEALAFFCIAMRRDVIDKLGMLDTIFGIGFFEDDDYCQRAMHAGYRLVCVDGVYVHHHLSASFNELEHGTRGELFRKNRAIYESRWGRWIPHTYRDAPGFGE